MSTILGIDVGTSTMKVSRRTGAGEIGTERIARTPGTPLSIVRGVERLIREASADLVALSSFRRALVVDDDTLVLARSSPPEPIVRPDTGGRTDALNPMAPIHRWADSVRQRCSRFQTLDVWLAERLTGRSVCAESLAWLTGLWDTARGGWDEPSCAEARVPPELLPQVLVEPVVVAGFCLPVIGDHEGTALACASAGQWPLRVAECGTALACMIGGGADPPPRLGVESPLRCGYAELVDAHFARRVHGAGAPAPGWMATGGDPSARDVVLAALRRGEVPTGPVLLCGGNATPRLTADLTAAGLDVVVNQAYTSSAGALILAERAVGSR